MEAMTRDAIVRAATEAARSNGGTLSRSDFQRATGIGQYHIYRCFPEGGWSEVLKLAGIARHAMHKEALSDEELLGRYHDVASAVGDIPTWAMLESRSGIARKSYTKRFGGLDGVLVRYSAWLTENHPSSALTQFVAARVSARPGVRTSIPAEESTRSVAEWSKGVGTQYGSPIDFRGLRHAPINEQGVVYLFGMVSFELGFLVEAVHPQFPDCEAKRCIDRRADRWQRVSIEFEYRSSNFRQHGHDPTKCDIIVCWDHDWAECPLEAVELRKVIDELEA